MTERPSEAGQSPTDDDVRPRDDGRVAPPARLLLRSRWLRSRWLRSSMVCGLGGRDGGGLGGLGRMRRTEAHGTGINRRAPHFVVPWVECSVTLRTLSSPPRSPARWPHDGGATGARSPGGATPRGGPPRPRGRPVARVVQHEIGLLDPLLPADLGPDARLGIGAVHVALGEQPLERDVGRAVDHDHPVQLDRLPVHRGQERDGQDHNVVGLLQRVTRLDHGDADGRVREGVQVGPGRIVGEGHRGQRRPVDGAVGRQYPLAEAVDQRLIGRAARGHHVPGHLVGVDEVGPALDEEIGHGRLSRPDAPGKADRQHRRMVAAIPGAAKARAPAEARYAAAARSWPTQSGFPYHTRTRPRHTSFPGVCSIGPPGWSWPASPTSPRS